MTAINTSIIGDLDSSYGLPQTKPKGSKELGQDAFLQLMLTQFRNQDPLKPQDPSEFLSQLAQVSSVQGISEMNKSIATLADSLYAGQALQASTVVGRNVLAPSDTSTIAAGGGFEGAIDLPASTQSAFVRVFDSSGALVREIPLGARAAGLANFEWNGTTNTGTPVPAGTYTVVAGYRSGSQEVQVDTYLSKRVASVSIGGDGKRTEITTDDNQKIGLADIRAIF